MQQAVFKAAKSYFFSAEQKAELTELSGFELVSEFGK